MRITKEVLRDMRNDIDQTLAAIGEKYGVVFKAGGVRFTDTNATFKLEASVVTAGGEVITKEAADFKAMAFMHGLDADDLGKTFRSGSIEFEIVGLKRTAHKYPILARSKRDGRQYKFQAKIVKELMRN